MAGKNLCSVPATPRLFLTCLITAAFLLSGGVGLAKGPRGGGGGGHTETYGNNLSVPVIFSEGHGVTGFPVSVNSGLRGTMLADNFDSMTTYTAFNYLGEVDYDGNSLYSNWFYEQKTEASWQAAWASAYNTGEVGVTRLDWGDSLLSQTWSVRSKIRVEITLYRLNGEAMQGYAMNHLAGEGITEVWGTADNSPLLALEPSKEPYFILPVEQTVYSNCARLTVSRINGDGSLTPIFSHPVYEKYGVTGPGGFSGEVNVGGKLIYGYNWDPRADNLDPGWYRVAFSLDPSAVWTVSGEDGIGGTYEVFRNVKIMNLDPLDAGTGGLVAGTGEEGDTRPYHAELAPDGYTSWVDVQLVARGGGGR